MADLKKIERLAEAIRINAEGALQEQGDFGHVQRSLTMIAHDVLEILAAARSAEPDGERIDTADHVEHGPTGETWVVAYVRGDKLSACGWPDTLAELADCKLIEKATEADQQRLLQDLAKSTGHRAGYARERLAAQQAADGVSADQPACYRCNGTGKEDGRDHCEACNPPPGVKEDGNGR